MKKVGRKFFAAIFCGAMAVAGLIFFAVNINSPNAPLLISGVVAPCLGVIAVVCGVEGVKDVKAANKQG